MHRGLEVTDLCHFIKFDHGATYFGMVQGHETREVVNLSIRPFIAPHTNALVGTWKLCDDSLHEYGGTYDSWFLCFGPTESPLS